MKIQIEKKQLKELEKKAFKLECLENGGVDNWEWYSEALKEYNEQFEIEEQAEKYLSDILDILACGGIEEPAGTGCGYGVTEAAQEELMEYLIHCIKEFKAQGK